MSTPGRAVPKPSAKSSKIKRSSNRKATQVSKGTSPDEKTKIPSKYQSKYEKDPRTVRAAISTKDTIGCWPDEVCKYPISVKAGINVYEILAKIGLHIRDKAPDRREGLPSLLERSVERGGEGAITRKDVLFAQVVIIDGAPDTTLGSNPATIQVAAPSAEAMDGQNEDEDEEEDMDKDGEQGEDGDENEDVDEDREQGEDGDEDGEENEDADEDEDGNGYDGGDNNEQGEMDDQFEPPVDQVHEITNNTDAQATHVTSTKPKVPTPCHTSLSKKRSVFEHDENSGANRTKRQKPDGASSEKSVVSNIPYGGDSLMLMDLSLTPSLNPFIKTNWLEPKTASLLLSIKERWQSSH